MARSVADCALLQNVIAGPHPSDVASLRPKLEIPSRLDGARGLRLALSVDLGCYDLDADVAANTLAAADGLRGARVTEVSLPWRRESINRAARIHFGMIFGPSVREIYAGHSDELTSRARRFVAESDAVGKDEFVAGLELESQIYAPLGQLLDQFDALLCPTSAVPALPAEYDTGQPVRVNGRESDDCLDVLMTLPFNIANRCPVLSIPSGLSRDGVPTGLSVVGKTYDDVTVFRVAAGHEQRFAWLDAPGHRPPL